MGSLVLDGGMPLCSRVLPSHGFLRENKDFPDPPARMANQLELSDCGDVGISQVQSLTTVYLGLSSASLIVILCSSVLTKS